MAWGLGHFTALTFHRGTFHRKHFTAVRFTAGTFHRRYISPLVHFTAGTFHRWYISPRVHFTAKFPKISSKIFVCKSTFHRIFRMVLFTAKIKDAKKDAKIFCTEWYISPQNFFS
jgi:hypothetical protein